MDEADMCGEIKWVKKQLRRVVRLCLSPEPVTDKNGDDTGRVTYRTAEALKALELLGKSCGMFSPRDTDTETRSASSQEDRMLISKIAERVFSVEP